VRELGVTASLQDFKAQAVADRGKGKRRKCPRPCAMQRMEAPAGIADAGKRPRLTSL